MLYVLAVLVPPLAVLLVGKPFQALINFGLCFLLWVPAVIHAIAVVSEAKADRRNEKLARAMRRR